LQEAPVVTGMTFMRHTAKVFSIAVIFALICIGFRASGHSQEDPRHPACNDARCKKIQSFLKAHYCGESPFGNGPEESCRIIDPGEIDPSVDRIANYDSTREREGRVFRQHGEAPSEIRKILIDELHKLGLPSEEDEYTYFTVWRSDSSGMYLAEAYHHHQEGYAITICKVILAIDNNGKVLVLRKVPFQKVGIDGFFVTIWSLLDLIDVDGDGYPDAVFKADNYESHWLEVDSIRNGSAEKIYSGLGYYL
jgi:hypothetical protein